MQISTNNITIAATHEEDIGAITAIYAHHVLYGNGTFEEVPPSLNEMQLRYNKICQNQFPYLTAKLDGHVVGYAYASSFRERSAYRFTVEDSIYIDPNYLQQGIGVLLLGELIKECRKKNYRQLLALIGDSNNLGSINLHARSDFHTVGIMHNVGYKFGQLLDVVIMQLDLK